MKQGGLPTITEHPKNVKQLIRKPFLFALLLSLPLWVVFNNYIIAIVSALLIAFLASMCHSLYVLRQHEKKRTTTDDTDKPA